MNSRSEWDAIYAAGQQMIRWPWTDLVSAVRRHCGDMHGKSVLELGCGHGTNSRFFDDEGAQYYGLEQATVDHTWAIDRVMQVDFTESIPGHWDLLFDRAAVTHNDTESIKRCLDLVFNALKPGSYYIGIDWFSREHEASDKGVPVDAYTRTDIPDGQFQGVGKVHFSTHAHLLELFERFEIMSLAHKVVTDKCSNAGTFASWNIVARKP